MQRRFFLRLAAVAGAAVAAPGCGFQLRQAPEFAFASVFIAAPRGSPLALELRRNLQSTGRVQVSGDGEPPTGADVVFTLLSEQQERAIVGRSSSGQVREYEIRLRVHFRLDTSDGRALLPDTELVQQSEVSYDESLALAKEDEIAMLFRSMQTNMVQQIMRRLAAVKSLN